MDDNLEKAGMHPTVDVMAQGRRKARILMNAGLMIASMGLFLVGGWIYEQGSAVWGIAIGGCGAGSGMTSVAAMLHLMRRTR